jgi:hypothetical protein
MALRAIRAGLATMRWSSCGTPRVHAIERHGSLEHRGQDVAARVA